MAKRQLSKWGLMVLTRLVGATIEANYINDVMKWPESISFDVVIIPNINKNNKENLQKLKKFIKNSKNKILTYC